MSFLQWRRFNFFDKESPLPHTPVSSPFVQPSTSGIHGNQRYAFNLDPDDEASSPALAEQTDALAVLKELRVTCAGAGRGHILLGDSDGYIHTINRQFQISSFRAFEGSVTHIHQAVEKVYLFSAGVDGLDVDPLVKIWNQEKLDPHRQGNRKPLCIRVIKANTGGNPTPVTCFAVVDSLTCMCVGFADGHLVILKGDLTREKYSKQKIIKASEYPITGLSFKELTSHQQKRIILFVSTTHEIISFNIHKDRETKMVVGPDFGCDPKCSTLLVDPKDPDNYLFVIGRKDAIYFFQHDGKGPCLAFEGEKLILQWFRGYLVVVGKEISPTKMSFAVQSSAIDDTALLSKLVADPGSSPSLISNTNIVTIYDIHNKYIAYSAPVPSIAEVFSEWGSLYLLTKDGSLIQLRERDTTSKLDILFKKNQFSLAISLAKSQQYDEEGLAEIFKQYGDHLYKKGDHEGAMHQYIKTIGQLEASFVIKKFLDSQRIKNLTAYLEELHKKRLANEDHTTLLLNCYTKLRDREKLNDFIKGTTVETNEKLSPQFDVETAIKVLRQAKFFDEALYLTEKYKCHDWYLKVQLEDKSNAEEALLYMRDKLDSITFLTQYLQKYGRFLMEKEPDRTTELIMYACGMGKRSSSSMETSPPGSKSASTSTQALNVGEATLNMGLGLLRPVKDEPLPDACEFLNVFVNNREKMIEFLEFIIGSNMCVSKALYNTLLDLYLSSYKKAEPSERDDIEKKIFKLLMDLDPKYDVNHALISCRVHNFEKGILYLYEVMKLYNLILHHYVKIGNEESILSTCMRFGDEDCNLWRVAFRYFAKHSGENQDQNLIYVLEEIGKRKLMSPIMVINILSQNESVPLSVTKDYLIRYLSRESEIQTENEKLILQYKDETEKIRQEIEDIKTQPRVFQASKCSACAQDLELPSVHFLCGHSYHNQCFESYSADNDSDCPHCLPEHRKLLSLVRTQDNFKMLHQIFKEQLNKEDVDIISLLSSYFSKGIFNKSSPEKSAVIQSVRPVTSDTRFSQ